MPMAGHEEGNGRGRTRRHVHVPRSVEVARRRLRAALTPRLTGAQITVGVMSALLGFALVVSAASRDSTQILQNTRTEDLIRLLDDLAEREQRLASEQRDLEIARERLQAGNPQAALAEARDRADALEVLAGTSPVRGQGVRITITDPSGVVDSPILLNAIQELRDAGAEAIQVGDVRVVASTWLADGAAGILVSGVPVTSPLRILAIGDPATLATALQIPGGVADTVRTVGARITIVTVADLRVGAVVTDPVIPPAPEQS